MDASNTQLDWMQFLCVNKRGLTKFDNVNLPMGGGGGGGGGGDYVLCAHNISGQGNIHSLKNANVVDTL